MDADGTLDLLVGDGNGDISLWRGIRGSAGSAPRFERDSSFAVRSHPNAVPAVGDLHGTGRLDLIVGTAAGGVRWFERGKATSPRE